MLIKLHGDWFPENHKQVFIIDINLNVMISKLLLFYHILLIAENIILFIRQNLIYREIMQFFRLQDK